MTFSYKKINFNRIYNIAGSKFLTREGYMKTTNISLKLMTVMITIIFINSCGELEDKGSYNNTNFLTNQNFYSTNYNTRFSRDEINHLVVDNNNKLVWQDNISVISISRTFQKAQKYCNSLDTLKLNWRLPTLVELSSIIQDSSENSHTNISFKYTRGAFYLSSNKFSGDTSSIWGVHFKAGFKIWIRQYRKSYSRCVANL